MAFAVDYTFNLGIHTSMRH